ncbi:uncharacterized protein V1513DRAFT_44835 [Lipomyces chichibuensis]|uniref:uncharacterized protein n=1 Tax=Lipomyces chichibuensis TaxID=1546026 RepID=UPI0033440D7B
MTTADISRLIRIAQGMGLHRDPALFRNAGLGLDEVQIQARRRVWWQLVHLDVTESLAKGLPTTSNPTQSDVKLQSVDFYELEEDKLLATFANCVSIGVRVLSRLLSQLYGINQPLGRMIAGILCELEEFRRHVQHTKDVMYSLTFKKRSSRASVDVLHKLAAQFSLDLDVMCEKLFLIYYFALSSSTPDANPDEQIRTHRKQVIHTAIRVVRIYLDYTEPKYLEFFWSLSRHNHFHAMIIILRDIFQYPHDIPEPTTLSGIKDEDEQLYGERIDVLQRGLSRTEYFGINTISPLAVKQWRTFVRLKDVVWQRKYAPSSPSSELSPTASSASSRASEKRPSCVQTKSVASNIVATPDPAVIDSAVINQNFAYDTSSVEYQDFCNTQFAADKVSGTIGTAGSNDYVQHVLGMNSWDIDWSAYGFDPVWDEFGNRLCFSSVYPFRRMGLL